MVEETENDLAMFRVGRALERGIRLVMPDMLSVM